MHQKFFNCLFYRKVFTLKTNNVDAGAVVDYQLTGISGADVVGGKLSGQVTISSSGTTSISIPIAADATTEGVEIITLTVQGKSASMNIGNENSSSTKYV